MINSWLFFFLQLLCGLLQSHHRELSAWLRRQLYLQCKFPLVTRWRIHPQMEGGPFQVLNIYLSCSLSWLGSRFRQIDISYLQIQWHSQMKIGSSLIKTVQISIQGNRESSQVQEAKSHTRSQAYSLCHYEQLSLHSTVNWLWVFVYDANALMFSFSTCSCPESLC